MTDMTVEKALQEAMAVERNGFDFYTAAAERVEDPAARAAFTALAEDERQHFEALQARYRRLLEGEAIAWGEKVPRSSQVIETIFSPSFRERLAGRHFEMSALGIGVLLERESIAFYKRQAESAATPEERAFFEDLVTWENEHYRALLAAQQELRADDWNANRFAPLL